jgi:hypothetical protein
MNAKLVAFTIVSVLALTSCGSPKGQSELDSTPSKQEMAWGHVVEACRLNGELRAVGFFATEEALNEMKKAAELDPTYFEYIQAHLYVTRLAKSGLDGSNLDEFMLQESKIDALCLAAKSS